MDELMHNLGQMTVKMGELQSDYERAIEALGDCTDFILSTQGILRDPDSPEGWDDPETFATYQRAQRALSQAQAQKGDE